MLYETIYNKFNRGEVDQLALSRDDVDKVNNSCALMQNFIPSRLGSMQYRPGWERIHELLEGPANGSEWFSVPFTRSVDDKALIVFNGSSFEVFTIDGNDEVSRLVTNSASSTINNGDFSFGLTSPSFWTDASGVNSVVEMAVDGGMALTGAITNEAVAYQTLSNPDIGAQHVIIVTVQESDVTLKIGTEGGSSYDIYEGSLGVGVHRLVFTPTGSPTITFSNSKDYRTVVHSVRIVDTEENFQLDSEGFAELSNITIDNVSQLRYDQSGDIIYFAHPSVAPFQIERRGINSWSVIMSRVSDGPFGNINTSDITLTPVAQNGNTVINASRDLFTEKDLHRVYRLFSSGQEVIETVTGGGSGTNSIRVSGVNSYIVTEEERSGRFPGGNNTTEVLTQVTSRAFVISIEGTFEATVTLQRSSDNETWDDIKSFTDETNESFDDELENSIFYYRLYVKSDDFTSGEIELSLSYQAGSITGAARVTRIISSTSVDVQVIQDFGNLESTRDWDAQQWNSEDGFPSAVQFFEGRLCYAGNSRFWASQSDVYNSFSRDIEGDSSSIFRTVGFGSSEQVSWLVKGNGLTMGVPNDELVVRSSSFGELLTDQNTNIRSGDGQGAAAQQPASTGPVTYYTHRNVKKLYMLEQLNSEDIRTTDLTLLNPSICKDGIKRVVVTRQPETRVYCLLTTGELRVYLNDVAEDVKGWSRIVTNGEFRDICVIRGDGEDDVYAVVRRTGVDYLERLGEFDTDESNCVDHYIRYDNVVANQEITLPEGFLRNVGEVEIWAGYNLIGKVTVGTDGVIIVPDSDLFPPPSNVIIEGVGGMTVTIGVSYEALWKSNKMSLYQPRSVLTELKRPSHIGLIARNMWPSLEISNDGEEYTLMPDVESGVVIDRNRVIEDYDKEPFELDSSWDSDPRVYVRATAPVTIQAMKYVFDSANTPSQ